jgi:hypothetical protein
MTTSNSWLTTWGVNHRAPLVYRTTLLPEYLHDTKPFLCQKYVGRDETEIK